MLLVGITVTMMVGLSLTVLGLPGPPDRVLADFAIDTSQGSGGWGTGDEVVRIRHFGGEPLEGDARVLIQLDGVTTSVDATDQGFADGTFSIGESWQTTLTISVGQRIQVGLVHDASNALVASSDVVAGLGGSTTPPPPPPPVITVDNAPIVTSIVGSVADTGNLGADDGSVATLTEANVAIPVVTVRNPTTVPTQISITSPNNVLASDNARATLNAATDLIGVAGFTAPAGATTITKVELGAEGVKSSGGTQDARLSYLFSGLPGGTNAVHSYSTGADQTYYVDVTGDRTWTPTNLANVQVQFQRLSSQQNINVDHLFLRVTYTTTPVWDSEAVVDFQAVGGTGNRNLELEYAAAGDTFAVQVWDWTAGQYNTRGVPLDQASLTAWTYPLTATEFDGSNKVRFRIVDVATASQGTLQLDYARVVWT